MLNEHRSGYRGGGADARDEARTPEREPTRRGDAEHKTPSDASPGERRDGTIHPGGHRRAMDEAGTDPGTLPLSALRVLASPLQLASAAMWHSVQRGLVAHYGALGDFVSALTAAVPELLSPRQRAELTLGLRARLIMDLCGPEGTPELATLQPHLDKMADLTGAWLSQSAHPTPPQSHFVDFVKLLLSNAAERERYFQEAFRQEFGASFDGALRSLTWRFLSRLEAFLPRPTFQQVALLLQGTSSSSSSSSSSVLEECLVTGGEELRTLLSHQRALRPPPQHHDPSSECTCILSPLKLAAAACAAPHHTPPEDEFQVQRSQAAEVRECSVVLRRLQASPARTRKTRLPEEESEDEDTGSERYPSPAAPPSEQDSWSHYSSASSSPATSDSWSHYSGDEASSPLSYSRSSYDDDDDSVAAGRAAERRRVAARAGPGAAGGGGGGVRQGECCVCKQWVQGQKLAAHIRSHFPDGAYACPRCDARFKLLSSFRLHMKKICYDEVEAEAEAAAAAEEEGEGGGAQGQRGALFRCGTCQQAFRHRLSLEGHARTHHELYCAVCRRVLRDRATLLRHQSSHTPYQCPRCHSSFTIFKHLLRHCQNLHQLGGAGAVGGGLRCAHCPKVFSKLRLLIGHEWKHTGHLPFQCSQCGLRFKNDTDLASHQRVHTREKPYLCSECGKTFAQRSNLLRHLGLVHGEARLRRRHQCPQCDKSFKEKGALLKHQRSKHLGQLPRHPCPYCGKMFSTSSIARHKLIHTGERPFACSAAPDCRRSFRSAAELKLHVLRHHRSERPFACAVCAKGFVSAGALNTHAKIHTGEKPFACHICGKAFLKRYSMLRHKRLLHTHLN